MRASSILAFIVLVTLSQPAGSGPKGFALARAGLKDLSGGAVEFGQQKPLPRPDHIVIVIEENKGYADVIGSSYAPYINSLAAGGALLDQFFAFHHPSQPNYMELFSGDSQGVIDDRCLLSEPSFDAHSLGGILTEKLLRFGGYAEDLPRPMECINKNFLQRHAPWVDFKDVSPTSNLDFTSFPKEPAGFASLPQVSLVIPSVIHDMHTIDTSNSECQQPATAVQKEVCAGDAWLKQNLDAYVKWAQKNNSLLIITWDEDSSTYKYPPPPVNTTPPDNRIPTLFVGAMVAPGVVEHGQYNHHDLLRTIEDMYGLRRIGGSVKAKQIEGIWRNPQLSRGTASMRSSDLRAPATMSGSTVISNLSSTSERRTSSSPIIFM